MDRLYIVWEQNLPIDMIDIEISIIVMVDDDDDGDATTIKEGFAANLSLV